jgi:branched-chain amino acid transport system permease protein
VFLFIAFLINGLVTGSIYALVALAFVLIYKASDILNFAQGELVMAGALIGYALLEQLHIPIAISLGLAFAFAILVGFIIERVVLRPMIGEPVASVIMVTLGLASIITGLCRGVWGSQNLTFPPIIPEKTVLIAGMPVSYVYLVSFSISVLFLILFSIFFKYSKMGIAMRATANNQQVAQSLGISVRRIFALSWAISTAIAFLVGILLGTINIVNVNMSFIGIKVFPIVVLGGLDSIAGAIVGAFVIGIIENLAGGYLQPLFSAGGVQEISSLIVLLIILLIRPYGLFGTRETERL